ncbi:MAG: Ig-like domain-containing protein, partial [Crocinitomicaceae bacterium]
MKNIITTIIAVLFFGLISHAQNYYVSSSAASNGSGSFSSPWNSFASLNSLLATSASIDTVFLKSGDVFRDEITVALASNFVITSYGTGNKPIISGADPVSSWTLVSTYWQANFTLPVVNFFVNNAEQILARYPNEGSYLTVDAGATNSTLTDAGLSAVSTATLNQSQVCVHTEQWCWEKSPISSSTSNSITYVNPTLRVPDANYGYFLYDHISYLTSGKEWKYDAASQKIYYQPVSGNPNTFSCEASVRSYGILLNTGVTNITINNISFEKQTESGIAILDSNNQHIIIDNCSFARQYKYGVEVGGKYAKISNSYFREVDGLAIYLKGTGTGTEVHHNTFRNNGGFRNSGIGLEINLSSIKGAYVDSCHVHHNDIDSAGYCGISMDGKYNLIERNIVKNAMLLNNDGAALKSFGQESKYNVFRNNFVSTSDGNIEGTPNGSFITPAIYFDFSTNNCTIQENTVYNRSKKGIFLNSGTNNNTVIGNVVYGGNYLLDFNGSPIIPTPMTGMTVKKNVLFAKDPAAHIIRMVDNTSGYNHGVIDSNYYFQPYNSNNYEFIPPSTSNNFSTWQSNTGYDVNTISSFVNWTLPTSNDTLFMNQTDAVVTISLGPNAFLDLDSNVICGNITLQPYTSKILIKVNATPTISGANSVCVGATTQLTGSETAATSNAWVSSPASIVTVSTSGLVTGVAAGTATITYTNNNGCSSTLSVTVNANPTITGSTSLCVGGTSQLTGSGTAATSNAWVSSNTSVATVSNTGLVTPLSSGTTTITYTNNNGCQAAAIITVTPSPSASISYAGSPYCSSITAAQPVTLTGTTGGTYSSTTGLALSASTGSITPSSSTPGTYTITYTTPASGGCSAFTTTTTVTITAAPTASVSYSGSSFCTSVSTAQSVTLTGTGSYTGGTYSSVPSGLTINTNTGAITPNTSTPGTYTITYTTPASGGCSAVTATTTVTITAIPTASITYSN